MSKTGKILRFDDVRGYGFIIPDGGGEDVFVHANDLLGEKLVFSPGTDVEFEVAQGDRGLKAFAVRVLGADHWPDATAPANGEATVKDTPAPAPEEDDGLCDVLSEREFAQELTEILLEKSPHLTGEQITHLRRDLVAFARKYGWVET